MLTIFKNISQQSAVMGIVQGADNS